jgi:hypothetical protein
MQAFPDGASGRHPGGWIAMAPGGAGRRGAPVVPGNTGLLRPPPHSPELNPVENVWEEPRGEPFGNAVSGGMDAPGERLLLGPGRLGAHPEVARPISARP